MATSRSVLAVGLLFALAGCQPIDLRALVGTEWRIVSIAGVAALPDRPPLLTFNRDGASGSGFCSTYSIEGMKIDTTANPARLSSSGASMQSSDCPEDRQRLDRAFFDALTGAQTIQLQGRRLVIDGRDGTLVFDPVVPPT